MLPELHTEEEEQAVLEDMLAATTHAKNTLMDGSYNAFLTEEEKVEIAIEMLNFSNVNTFARDLVMKDAVVALALFNELSYWNTSGHL